MVKTTAKTNVWKKPRGDKARLDKKRNIDKIAAAILANPLATVREIADITGISKSTVAEHIKSDEVGLVGAKDDRIISLTDKDYSILEKIQDIKLNKLTTKPEDISNADIDKRDNTATKRYSLFRWDATDKGWGLKNNIKELSDDELLSKIL